MRQKNRIQMPTSENIEALRKLFADQKLMLEVLAEVMDARTVAVLHVPKRPSEENPPSIVMKLDPMDCGPLVGALRHTADSVESLDKTHKKGNG